MIFLRALASFTELTTVAKLLRKQLHKIRCDSCIVVLECTQTPLGETIAAFCGLPSLEMEGAELSWFVVDNFTFVPTVAEDNKDDEPIN